MIFASVWMVLQAADKTETLSNNKCSNWGLKSWIRGVYTFLK